MQGLDDVDLPAGNGYLADELEGAKISVDCTLMWQYLKGIPEGYTDSAAGRAAVVLKDSSRPQTGDRTYFDGVIDQPVDVGAVDRSFLSCADEKVLWRPSRERPETAIDLHSRKVAPPKDFPTSSTVAFRTSGMMQTPEVPTDVEGPPTFPVVTYTGVAVAEGHTVVVAVTAFLADAPEDLFWPFFQAAVKKAGHGS